jgi:peroxiredoxin Q/BCP
MLKVGDAAPAFTVQTHEGKEISLASLKGKKVVLWFYPKADTPG